MVDLLSIGSQPNQHHSWNLTPTKKMREKEDYEIRVENFSSQGRRSCLRPSKAFFNPRTYFERHFFYSFEKYATNEICNNNKNADIGHLGH